MHRRFLLGAGKQFVSIIPSRVFGRGGLLRALLIFLRLRLRTLVSGALLLAGALLAILRVDISGVGRVGSEGRRISLCLSVVVTCAWAPDWASVSFVMTVVEALRLRRLARLAAATSGESPPASEAVAVAGVSAGAAFVSASVDFFGSLFGSCPRSGSAAANASGSNHARFIARFIVCLQLVLMRGPRAAISSLSHISQRTGPE
jgi:hypothetical protein